MTKLCRKKRWAALALAVVGCGLFAPAQAEVTIAGTRVVYPAQQREVAVKLNNVGARPALVQVWVDDGDPKQSPDTSKAPFLVSPPVVRIEPGKGQALRLVYGPSAAGAQAPDGRESVYWLNVLEIPPNVDPAEAEQNHLQVAFRTRIKLFLRPPGLPGDPEAAARGLRWRVVRSDAGGWALECANPGAFHVSFGRVALSAGGREYRFDNAGMLAPGASLRLDLADLAAAPAAGAAVAYSIINDYGGRTELQGQTAE
ncbi:hypothetical protein A7A76_11630 [Lysobacter enzymogenes]|uniref:fimbrial biogenesis chaperone n=1 Tax=Lysobacter enzymogenes TaxID=69 RepID=UPI0019D1271C|nr:fimbria/pilus periplasmic chaperone [Lysobacter enzymogenes]MBN7135427.1 hypothetical protein [Lysobacter enzymogenes]